MGKKIFFQDGSAIEISSEIIEPGEMATSAYRKIIEFIEDELVDIDDAEEEDLDELTEEDFDELDEDDDLMLDDDDLVLDDDWEEEEDLDDDW